MLCNISNRVHNCIALLLFFPASKLSNQPHQIPQCWNYACYHDNLGKKSLYFFIFVQLQNESRFDLLIKLRSRNRVKCELLLVFFVTDHHLDNQYHDKSTNWTRNQSSSNAGKSLKSYFVGRKVNLFVLCFH